MKVRVILNEDGSTEITFGAGEKQNAALAVDFILQLYKGEGRDVSSMIRIRERMNNGEPIYFH